MRPLPTYSLSSLLPPLFPSNPHRPTPTLATPQKRENTTSNPSVVIPHPPWVRSPLPVHEEDLVDLSAETKSSKKREPKESHLTSKVRGGRSRHAMRRIAQSIAMLREIDPQSVADNEGEDEDGGEDREGWAARESGVRVPWVRSENLAVFRRTKKVREVTAAEVTLEKELLENLRGEARKMRKWIKAKQRGVTDEVVDAIGKAWKESELAMVKIVEPLSRNMDRAREIVEEKTGGLVVWSKRDTLVVYRGSNFDTASKAVDRTATEEYGTSSPSVDFLGNYGEMGVSTSKFGRSAGLDKDEESHPSSMFTDENTKPVNGTLYERETDRLLDGLGPRFIDWWMRKPLPVDADLLPEVAHDFRPPIRRCPPHVRPALTDYELTYLRKLARPLPIHFALGKNNKLQGLAAAIIKLWERSLVAKIAVKRGIPDTNNEIMASKLKHLTGGTLILRNKFYIVLYRGKDFLSPSVADSINQREIGLRNLQFEEEQSREKTAELVFASEGTQFGTSIIGTFMEFQDFQTNYSCHQNKVSVLKIKLEAQKARLEKELRKQKHQLSIMRLKMDKSDKILAELSLHWKPSAPPRDRELLTEEERQKFRKIGLKMDEILLLGRRGIYDGVIGNIHLHWRHRELVKIVTMQKGFSQVIHTALLLENETGGILVALETYRSGYAIIIFRGKNYVQPPKLIAENLPTKREAFRRSIEVQRRGSLRFFARQREESILYLERRIKNLEEKIEFESWKAIR